MQTSALLIYIRNCSLAISVTVCACKFTMKLLILTLALASTVLADQTFYNLKTTWGPNPVPGFGYFNEQPRTTTEADAAGFTQIGNCDENDE